MRGLLPAPSRKTQTVATALQSGRNRSVSLNSNFQKPGENTKTEVGPLTKGSNAAIKVASKVTKLTSALRVNKIKHFL